MFQDWLRVNKQTFSFLCETLAWPSIKKSNILMTASNDVETKVVVTLARLAIGNTLSMIGDLYGIDDIIMPIIVQVCCKIIYCL